MSLRPRPAAAAGRLEKVLDVGAQLQARNAARIGGTPYTMDFANMQFVIDKKTATNKNQLIHNVRWALTDHMTKNASSPNDEFPLYVDNSKGETLLVVLFKKGKSGTKGTYYVISVNNYEGGAEAFKVILTSDSPPDVLNAVDNFLSSMGVSIETAVMRTPFNKPSPSFSEKHKLDL